MSEVTLVGIDLAKRIFHLCAVDAAGAVVWEKRVGRAGVLKVLSGLPPCVVAMEACGGSHDWGRRIMALGHQVRLIHARRVASFTGVHKSDRIDTRAICEAARQPATRFIAVKSREQQDTQSLLRLRDGLVAERTATVNRLRGILGEYGIVLPTGRLAGLRRLRTLMTEPVWERDLGPVLRLALADLLAHIGGLDARVAGLAKSLGARIAADPRGARLLAIPGLGPINTATVLATVTDPALFKSGRHLAAWIGLVPRQDGTGGRMRLRGITKHGNSQLRRDLIHGARALVRAALRRDKPRSAIEAWIHRRRHDLKPCEMIVAVANKLARVIWVVMTTGKDYQPYPA